MYRFISVFVIFIVSLVAREEAFAMKECSALCLQVFQENMYHGWKCQQILPFPPALTDQLHRGMPGF